jgi:prepilin signal peptidase PulO-like enzyme (type II secretory pathway)
MEIIFTTVSFWIGAVFASYFNVVVDRGFRKSLMGRSHCDHCQAKISPVLLLPVVSTAYLFIFNEGKTLCCKSSLSPQYLLTEVLGGISFLLMYLHLQTYDFSFAVLAAFLIHLLFLYLSVYDIWNFEIDIVPIGIMSVLLFTSFLVDTSASQAIWTHELFSFETVYTAVFYCGVVISLIFFSDGKGLGVGDVFIVAFISLSLGWVATTIALQVTIYTATAIGLIYAGYKRQFKGLLIPLVPFLLLGWQIALNHSEEILSIINELSYI